MADSDAVAALKKGDLNGLEELLTRYQDKALRVVYLIVQNEPLAEDVVVDTFLRIANRIQSFDPGQPFEPYLMRSLVNAALNTMRRKHISLDDGEESGRLEKLLDTAEPLEDLVEANELRQEIRHAIATLSPRQRVVIVQRYYLGMSEADMAVALDAPRGTIKWLLNRARQNLNKLLTRQG